MKSIISAEMIADLLPQKHPFGMVSHLVDYQLDSVETGLLIEGDNIFVENGFFNESGMIENIAQSIALHTSYSYFLRNEKAPIGYIGSIKHVKLISHPKVNTEITTKVEVIKEFGGVTLVNGKIIQNGEVLMEAQMKTILAEEINS